MILLIKSRSSLPQSESPQTIVILNESLQISQAWFYLFLLVSLPPNPSCLNLATSHSGYWWTDPAPDRYESQQGGGPEGTNTLGPGITLALHHFPYSTSPVALYTKPHDPVSVSFWETSACTHFLLSPDLIYGLPHPSTATWTCNFLQWLETNQMRHHPSVSLTFESLLLDQTRDTHLRHSDLFWFGVRGGQRD